MIELESHLEGQWKKGTGKKSTLINPTTGVAVAQTSTEGLDFASALSWSREVGGAALRGLTFAERGALLKQMSKVLHEARDELIEASIVNAGTTRSDSKFDIDGATGTLAYYAGLGKKLGDRTHLVEGEGEQLTRSPRFWGHHVLTPRRGVAVHVNAFNFPAWGFAEKAACAILAGMPAITKPATATAMVAERAVEIVVQAGILPEGALQLVCGSTGDLLDLLGPQDVLAFTGSASTAAQLRERRNFLDTNTRVNVEADSLNAAILGPGTAEGSPTFELFLKDVTREMTQKAGQKCTAIRRAFVPRALYDAAAQAIGAKLARISVGNPRNEAVRMGALVSRAQFDGVREGLAQLLAEAKPLYDGRNQALVDADPAVAACAQPVLLGTTDPVGARVLHDVEVFGPVSTLMPYDNEVQAFELIRRGQGSLVASVYSADPAFTARAALELADSHGRVHAISPDVASLHTGHGNVMPHSLHGGPGRAGGGEELGGLRALGFYHRRSAVQASTAALDALAASATPLTY